MRTRTDLTSVERKQMPVDRGFVKYFPDAMLVVAMLSARADLKHSPNADPMAPDRPQWNKGTSEDHGDCLQRHQMDVGSMDKEIGLDHMAHVAWRGLAQLQRYIDANGLDSVIDWNWKQLTSERTKPREISSPEIKDMKQVLGDYDALVRRKEAEGNGS